MSPSSQDMMLIASLQFELDNNINKKMPEVVVQYMQERIQTLKEGNPHE